MLAFGVFIQLRMQWREMNDEVELFQARERCERLGDFGFKSVYSPTGF